jgi:hypothetical protein
MKAPIGSHAGSFGYRFPSYHAKRCSRCLYTSLVHPFDATLTHEIADKVLYNRKPKLTWEGKRSRRDIAVIP